MASQRFDAVVIGAGPAGYVAAIRLAQLGKATALVEKESLGGASLNWGCIPSKALIAAANLVEDVRRAAERGIAGEPQCARHCTDDLDLGKLREFRDAVLKKLTKGLRTLERGYGVAVIRGSARFVSSKAIEVRSLAGDVRLEAEAFVIATGARPATVGGVEFDGKDVWSVREALELREVPQRLVAIGAGATGLELATAYAKLGSKVSLVEALPSILPGTDRDAVRLVEKALRRRRVDVHVSARAKGLERADDQLVVLLEAGGKAKVVACDRVLVAAGVIPSTEGLGLDAIGVEVGEGGFVAVDARMQTNVPGIFCAGDAAGPPFLAHKASREGELAAEAIAGKPPARPWLTTPRAIFTDPELATAGLSEHQARARGHDPVVGRFAFAALGRALAIDRPEGFVKVVADRGSKLLLGVTIAGPAASDLIAEPTLALEMGAHLEDVANTVHAHPTLPEAFMEACRVALGRAIHAPRGVERRRTAAPRAPARAPT